MTPTSGTLARAGVVILLGFLFMVLVPIARGRGGAPALPRNSVDHLEVWKDEHELRAFSRGRLVRTYRVAIGGGEAGPKTHEGDRRTPEGRYTIDSRHRSQRFHRFLHISYPNGEDRERYRDARRAGAVPNGPGIGGVVGIHGESDRRGVRMFRNRIDWTLGCIAVSDEEVEELYGAVRAGASIEIYP